MGRSLGFVDEKGVCPSQGRSKEQGGRQGWVVTKDGRKGQDASQSLPSVFYGTERAPKLDLSHFLSFLGGKGTRESVMVREN